MNPHDPDRPADVGDLNVERLLGKAYRPEAPSPEFCRRLTEQMCATAADGARRRPATHIQAWHRTWLLAAAASVLIVAPAWLTLGLRPVRPAGDREVPVASITPAAQSVEVKHLTARPRPPAPPADRLELGVTLQTGAAERRLVTLPDESRLCLNNDTSVTLAALRGLEVARGEVLLELGPTVAEPLTVKTPDRALTALTGKLAVRCADAGTSVLVTQGQVRVQGLPRPLQAGQELAAASDEPAPAPRTTHTLAWAGELLSRAEPALLPENAHRGGALVVTDSAGQEASLSLRSFHLDVHIEDGFARTTIDQTYFNHEPRRLEGTFYFPLPPDASLSRLAMYVDGTLMEGGMAERDHARTVFESIVARQKDPALLEWVDGSTFKMRVFPLEGRQEKRILLSYTQKLSNLYGHATYRFPAGHNLQTVRDWSCHALVKGGAALGWNCPSHPLTAATKDSDLLLDGSAKGVVLNRDLVLELQERDHPREGREQARFATVDHDGSRYLMLRYRPTLAGTARPQRRDWVFLCETSGDRDPMVARVQVDIVRTLLENAEREDTFAVLAAGAEPRPFAPEPRPATPENVREAVAFLDRAHLVGALDLKTAFTRTATFLKTAANPHLVHVGSGLATLGERRADALLKALPDNVRYVGVGVGRRWDRSFMKAAAERSDGLFTQINPDERVGWRARELLATLDTPRLLGVRVVDEAEKATFLLHSSVVAQGEEVCALSRTGRDTEPLPESVTVAATLEGKPFRRSFPVRDVAGNAGYLPRTWAKLEIDRLLADDPAQHKARITELSKAMYVMTPFTSLLVLENDAMYTQFNVDRGRKDHWAMYPAPPKVPVVHEPLGTALSAAPAGRRPATEVLQTILVRKDSSPDSTDKRVGKALAVNALGALVVPGDPLMTVQQLTRQLDVLESDIARPWGTSSRSSGARVDRFNDGWDDRSGGVANGGAMRLHDLYIVSPTEPPQSGPADPNSSVRGLLVTPPSRALTVPQQRGGFGGRTAGGLAGGMSGTPGLAAGGGGFDGFRGTSTTPIAPIRTTLSGLSTVPDVTANFWGRYDWSVTPLAVRPGGQDAPALNMPGPTGFGLAQMNNPFGLAWRYQQGDRLRAVEDAILPVLDPYAVETERLDTLQRMYKARVSAASLDDTAGKQQPRAKPPQSAPTGRLSLIDPTDALLLGLLAGRAPAPTMHQRVAATPDDRGFTDLTAYAPGLHTSRADILAVLEAEASGTVPAAPGRIDPAARALIDRARSAGWQAIALSTADGESTCTLTFDGEGRYRCERTLPGGLREQVVCDGQQLWHLYPELALGARRSVSRFHRTEWTNVVPWLLPPAEDLARGADLTCPDPQTVAVIVQGDTTASLMLRFAPDGRLIERQTARGRETYQREGVVITHYAEGGRVERRLPVQAAEAPVLVPNTHGLLVLPLPLRTQAHVVASSGQSWDGQPEHLGDALALPVLAAQHAEGRDLPPSWSQHLAKAKDRSVGHYVLLSRDRAVAPPEQADEPAIAHYLRWLAQSEVATPPSGLGDGLLVRLAECRALIRLWNDAARPIGATEAERFAAFVRRPGLPHLAWTLVSAVVRSPVPPVTIPGGCPALRRRLLDEAAQHLAGSPGLSYSTHLDLAELLRQHGLIERSRQCLREAYTATLAAGVLPPLDREFRKAFLDDAGGASAWQAFVRDAAQRLRGEHWFSGLVGLAWQCWELDDAALAGELLDLVKQAEDPPPQHEYVQSRLFAYLWQTRQDAAAEQALRDLLDEKSAAQRSLLWRVAARYAEQRRRPVEAAGYLERALEMEYRHLPEVIDVQAVRRDYGALMSAFEQQATALATLQQPIPEVLADRVVRAADRWRALDVDGIEACKAASGVLRRLGKAALAWEYLSTTLTAPGSPATATLELARALRNEGEHVMAEQAFRAVTDAEPGNAQVLLERTENLRLAGRAAEANRLRRE